MAIARTLLLAALTAVTLTACGKSAGKLPSGGSREMIPDRDDPGLILPGASKRLFDNLTWGDVGAVFGAEIADIPYPDTYWPYTSGGVDWNWSNTGSPLTKYMAMVSPRDTTAAEQW